MRHANHRRHPLPRVGAIAAIVMAGVGTMGPARAADTPPIKPGLWEMVSESQKINGQAVPDRSAEMAAQLKNLPPEMRQKIEAQMKAHGMQMPTAAPGGGMAMRMCVTPEMLAQNRWQATQGDCQSQVTSRSGSTWKWAVRCTKPPAQGEGTTTFNGSEAYSSEMRMSTQHQGQPQVMTMKHRARWLSSDCGSVKPVQPPAAQR